MSTPSPIRAAPSGPRDRPRSAGKGANEGTVLIGLGPRRLGLLLLALLALVAGWQAFFFVCDDALIAFRYIQSRRLGFGYTWNPPPFPKVEGYTSFAWVALLDAVWSLTGVRPTVSSPWIGLGCGVATLGLVAARASRLSLGLFGLVLLGTVSNRTFLTWTSSGLEAPLFMLLVVAWALEGTGWARGGRLAALATAIALVRPDGLLFAAATAALVGAQAVRTRAPRRLLALAPLLLVGLHVLWRHATYDAWLPNTHAAKVHGPWPEAGLRYLGSFVLEYAWFAWLPPLALAVWHWRREQRTPRLAVLCVVGTLAAHTAYYVFRVGGDHHEYRILAHLVPLLWLSLPALVASLAPGRRALVVLTALALSLPIPWTHWQLTRSLHSFGETRKLQIGLHEHLPLGPWTRSFDALQAWLIPRYIGTRHQEHLNAARLQLARFPDPACVLDRSCVTVGRYVDGAVQLDPSLDPEPVMAAFPVLDAAAVGGPGWGLPGVVVLDVLGLNDAVIARSRHYQPERTLGHDRLPPAGYIDCFKPNAYTAMATLVDGRLVDLVTPPSRWYDAQDLREPLPPPRAWEGPVEVRPWLIVVERPLSAEEVDACVTRDWTQAGPGQRDFSTWRPGG